ncbi:hypothetical protein [Pseudomonas tussilaginis]|uniref:hypothetical protein n=1 Tax=Pseudomonas sp. 5 TaxID=1619949 RepID=UPI00069646DF|nr:hypothetical protein [Pseudomonas sp. 5]
MPLTAFSVSRQQELDVDQLLQLFADQYQRPKLRRSEPIPEIWKQVIHADVECPACFAKGAEIVRATSSKVTGEAIKQAYFRFPGGHHAFCDFAALPPGEAPEGLVQFSSTARDGLSRAVRDLVCRGIQLGLLDQARIRSMREWFHQKKLSAVFQVTLDPQVFHWVAAVQAAAWPVRYQPRWLTVNHELMGVPGFQMKTAMEVMLARRHESLLAYLSERAVMLRPLVSRIEKLLNANSCKLVFDPTNLKAQYDVTQELARFISTHYDPVHRALGRGYFDVKASKPLMAFTALLLFLSNWDLNKAASLFAQVASYRGTVDQNLGNVMGLNPFHDYDAWAALKALQEIPIQEFDGYDLDHRAKEWMSEAAAALASGQSF